MWVSCGCPCGALIHAKSLILDESLVNQGRESGAPRHGTAREFLARHGIPRHGKRCFGTARNPKARHGNLWHGTESQSTARETMARHGNLKHGTARHLPDIYTYACNVNPCMSMHETSGT
jgi:hypothetical protein